MKVIWNNYFKCTTGTLTTKTIVTEDPIGFEAETLRKYALIAPLLTSSMLEKMTSALPDRKYGRNKILIFPLFVCYF